MVYNLLGRILASHFALKVMAGIIGTPLLGYAAIFGVNHVTYSAFAVFSI